MYSRFNGLDNRSPGGKRSEPGFFHGIDSSAVQRLARHPRSQQSGSVKRFGGRVFLLSTRVYHILRLILGGQEGRMLVAVRFRVRFRLPGLAGNSDPDFPPDLHDALPDVW